MVFHGRRWRHRAPIPILIAACLTVLLLLPIPARGDGAILRLSDGKSLSPEEAAAEASRSKLVFMGELHDQEEHHKAQLAFVSALHEAEIPLALAVEMIRADHQADLDRWVAGKTSLEEFIDFYYRDWGYPWSFYKDLFIYAREHSIPLVGLNVPPELPNQVSRRGWNSLSAEQKASLPGVSCRVDRVYEEFIRRAHGEGNLGMEGFKSFCEAQMVWDTAMAHNLLAHMEKYPERTVMVLAGSGHSWKRGVPSQVDRMARRDYRVILPEIPGRLEPRTANLGDADYLWLGITRLK